MDWTKTTCQYERVGLEGNRDGARGINTLISRPTPPPQAVSTSMAHKARARRHGSTHIGSNPKRPAVQGTEQVEQAESRWKKQTENTHYIYYNAAFIHSMVSPEIFSKSTNMSPISYFFMDLVWYATFNWSPINRHAISFWFLKNIDSAAVRCMYMNSMRSDTYYIIWHFHRNWGSLPMWLTPSHIMERGLFWIF